MATPRACSHCLRTLYRPSSIPKAGGAAQLKQLPRVRAFSSHPSPRLQRSRQSAPEIPPTPPTTTGTITSNITAPAPQSLENPLTAHKTEESTPSSSSSSPSAPNPDHGPSAAEMQRQITSTLSRPSSSLPRALASRLHVTAPSATNPYLAYGVSQTLFQACSSQADYTIPVDQRSGILTGQGPPKTATGEDLGVPITTTEKPTTTTTSSNNSTDSHSNWWHATLHLPYTFSTWSQVTYLHMHLLLVRLRALPDPTIARQYQQYLVDHFSHAAEDKMVLLHGMAARGVRNKYLKDLFLQWRGVVAAYDEGLVRGDAVLAGAVWRNLWKGEGEEVDWEKVATVVGYIREVVRALGRVDVEVGREEGGDMGKEILAAVVGKREKGFGGGVFERASRAVQRSS